MLHDLIPAALTDDPVANFFIEYGGVVAGAGAIGYAIGAATGGIAQELGYQASPKQWGEQGLAVGSVFGLVFGGLRLAGVQ